MRRTAIKTWQKKKQAFYFMVIHLMLFLIAMTDAWNQPATVLLSSKVSRRTVFLVPAAVVIGVCSQAIIVQAEEETTNQEDRATKKSRPFAPIECLVPAMKQRLLLDQAVRLSQKIESSTTSSQPYDDLKAIIASPTTSFSPKAAILGTRRYADDLKILNGTDLSKLSGAATRASMNFYTANLRFGESYILTASPEDKSRMLRENGRFPDVKQVITADLDLRDLQRNYVQTTLDDVSAELYQTTEPDGQEVTRLLQEAVNAFDKWMTLIEPEDVHKAQEIAMR